MTEWVVAALGDLAAPTPNALATGPFGSAISAKHFRASGVPVIRGSNLSTDVGIRLVDDGLAFLEAEKAKTFARSLASRGDLVFTCWGTVGQVGLVDERSRYDAYVVSNKQMKLTPDPARVDSLFLYYLLSNKEMVDAVRGQAIGAAVPGFNLGQLRELRVRMPPLNVQRAIATSLAAFDDLIENSWRRVRALQEMAQAIYGEWFVHFRYPGHESATLVDSPLGPIPDRWTASTLGQVLELRYGKALTKGNRRGGNVAVVSSAGVVGWHDEQITNGPAIVVGRKGNVGSVTWVDGPAWPIDTAYFVDTNLPLRYVVEQLRRTEFLNTHAAVPGLSREQAYSRPFLQPPGELMAKFSDLSQMLASQASAIAAQADGLISLRDLLLPKLVTGQIDVSSLDLGALVEESVA